MSSYPITPDMAALWDAEKRIDAIKLYRDTYGTGLVDAKDALETWAATISGDTEVVRYIAKKRAVAAGKLKVLSAVEEWRLAHGKGGTTRWLLEASAALLAAADALADAEATQ